jgi:TP901 family phage tail tape measure protein/lambda family phage tail tape measure protein
MAMNMDAALRIKASVQGGNAIKVFNRDLKGLDGAAKLSTVELGRMNIAINRMARETGNTTAGLRQHISALSSLRDRVEIGGKAYNRLGGEIEKLRGKLKSLDRDAEKTGDTLKDKLVGGLATLGVGRIAAGISKTAGSFDQEVRKAAAIEGGGNYDELRRSIEGVAAAAAGTPTQVAQLAVALSRAGFTADETSKSLAGIIKGAEATAIPFEEMGSVMSDVMRSFGIEVGKTESVVDILVKSANSSNQTVQNLGEAMKYAAPVARTLGVNVNDLAATMALMANNGIRGSDAGTALRSGLSRLQLAASGSNDELMGLTRGSALLAKAMKAMGADVLDAQGKLKPMDQVILSLRDNMNKLPIGQRAEIAKALFGDEAGSKFLALLNSSQEQIVSMFGKIRNSGGAASETQKQMQGFAYSMEVLGGNIEIVTNAIGDKFNAVLGPLVGGLNAAISWTQTWPKPLRDVAAAAAAAGIAVGGFVLATKALGALGAAAMFAGIASKAGALALALKSLSAAAVLAKIKIIALNAALLINPWFALAAGITAAAVALGSYKSANDKLVASLAGGDPTAITKGRAELRNLDSRIANLESSRDGASSGRAQNSLQQQLNKLRAERQSLNNALAAAKPATTSNIIDAAALATGTGDGSGSGSGDGSGKSSGSAKAKEKSLAAEIASALKGALSLSDAQAAGIVGNFMRESALNPRVNEGGAVGMPRGVGGYGLAQWTGSRQQDLIRFAGGAGQAGDLQTQLRFVVQELLGSENRALQSLRSAQSPEQAAVIFDRDYERSGVKALDERKANARQVYSEIAGTGPGAGLGDFAKGLEAAQKEAEQTAKQLTAARELLSTKEAAFAITSAASPLEKLSAKFDQQRASRIREYAGKLSEARSDEERMLIVQSQTVDIRGSEIAFQEQRKTLIAEQLKLEEEKAKVVTELATRNSIGAGVRQGLDGYVESVGNLRDAVGQLTTNSIGGLEESLVSLATTGSANFKEFATSVLKDVTRMIIRQLILRTIMQAIGFISGGGNPEVNAIQQGSSIEVAANGATFANGIAKFASGGIVNRPTLFKFASGGAMRTGLMGEAGPEAIMPLRRGADGKLGVAGGGGSGTTNVTVNVDASGSSQISGNPGQAAALGRAVSQAVQQELIKQKRPGGLLTA